MPFTFDHACDPMMRVPTIQSTVVGALMTLGFVPASRDASGGALWRAMRRRGWVEQVAPGGGTIILRRFAMRPGAAGPRGLLLIGAELDGEPYRIACEGLAPEEQARMRRLLALEAIPNGVPVLFRARSIQASSWARVAMAKAAPGSGAGRRGIGPRSAPVPPPNGV